MPRFKKKAPKQKFNIPEPLYKGVQTPLKALTKRQQEYINAISHSEQVVSIGPAGTGKAQPLDSQILTTEGWKLMGEIQIGDMLVMPEGGSAPVSGVYPQGERDIFRIEFEDGRIAECCEEHLWRVYCHSWEPARSRWRVISTAEITRLLSKPSYMGRLYIQLPAPIESEVASLPIDPYVVGALIGDGGITAAPYLSSADEEVLAEVSKGLPDTTHLVSRGGYDYSVINKVRGGANTLTEALRGLELLGKKATEKTIPQVYMEGSIEQTYSLLQGLFDTDGTVSKEGSVSYSTSSFILACQVQQLIRRIGGLARISNRRVFYPYKDAKKLGEITYQVNVRVVDASRLFRLTRKLGRLPKNYQYKDCLRLRIKSVTPSFRREAQCIAVDHPSHLYITDEYVVTHNTYIQSCMAADALARHDIDRIVLTRPAVGVDEQHGFLPGDLGRKIAPWVVPFTEVIEERLGTERFNAAMRRGDIQIVPLAFMRGRTFKNAYVILDEAQNTTYSQIKMFLTRIGEDAKVLINGDIKQSDLDHNSGLKIILDIIRKQRLDIPVIEFTVADVVRSGTCRMWTEAFIKHEENHNAP